MKNMKIRTKLITGFLLVALLCGVVGGVSIYGLQTLSINETDLYEQGVLGVYKASQVIININQQRIASRDIVINCDNEDNTEFNASLARLSELETEFDIKYKDFENMANSDEINTMLSDLNAAYYGDYESGKQLITDAAKTGDRSATKAALAVAGPAATKVAELVDRISEQLMKGNDNTQKVDTQTANNITLLVIILMAVSILVAILMALYNSSIIAAPISRLVEAAERIAKGDVAVDITDSSKDEVGQLSESFSHMIDSIKEQALIMESIAEGDYRNDIQIRSDNDIMNRAIQNMIDANNRAFYEINMASTQVSAGARQIAQGAQNLAEGSTEQAASVQELSASIADVRQQTQKNADNALHAMEATNKAGSLMGESIRDMEMMTQAMGAISADSAAIIKVVKVIDDIASKTNLLSLNASVEAARVGQHGKGFAVVADEVRALAAKSTDAAKETAQLIEGSARRVNEGNEILARTDESLRAVAEQSQLTSSLINEIAKSSQDQAAAISEINVGIDQISTVVQGNSATAEESAAAAQEMSSQSSLLNEIIQRFKLKGEDALEAPRATRGNAQPRRELPPSATAHRGLGKY